MNVNSTEYFRNRREARYQGAWAFLDGKIFAQSNIKTNGTELYSYDYHFPMAIKDGARMLVNDDRYSVTTSKHQSALRTVLGIVGYAPTDELVPDPKNQTRWAFRVWARA